MTFHQQNLLRRIAFVTVLSLPVALPPVAFSQAMTAEQRKALAEQKKAEAEARRTAAVEKRKQMEDERQARADLQKALLARDYEFKALGLKFTKPAGWKDTAVTPDPNAVAIGVPGEPAVAPMPNDGPILSLEFPSAAPVKPGAPQVVTPRYTVSMSTLPAGTPIEVFVDHTNKSLDTSAAGPLTYQMPTDAKLGTGELPAKLVVARSKPGEDKQVSVVRRVVAVKDDKGYVFELATPNASYARTLVTAEQLEKSVTFADVTTAPSEASAVSPSPTEPPAVGNMLPPAPTELPADQR